MLDFISRLSLYAKKTQDALDGYIPENKGEYGVVIDAMRYSLLGGGKRLRAALVLHFCKECGKEEELALPFAGAIEMIHAYSLIHDDLPCMDDDDIRRGKPSCHIAFGESTALLAGDGLLTKAFEVALTKGDKTQISAEQILKATALLAQAAGCDGMIGGQVVDLKNETRTADEAVVNFTNSLKTGALIRVSAQMGCVIGGATEDFIKMADSYAAKIGLAFQIVDDILDTIGDASVLGKPIGSDADNHKTTYVSLYGVEKAREIAEKLVSEAKEALTLGGVTDPFLYDLANMVTQRKN